MTAQRIPLLIGGEWREARSFSLRCDPYRGDAVAEVPRCGREEVDAALAAASAAREAAAETPPAERAALLRRTADLVRDRSGMLAETMARETGKAIADARREIDRSVSTLDISAEEAVRIAGEHVPMDSSPNGAGKLALLMRYPLGVVAAITPFNAPVNLTCHKLGPAIAAGDTVVLKPSPASSLTVHRLVELFQEAGAPPGLINTVFGEEAGALLVEDARADFISFTGSSRVGALISRAAGLRRLALELGGNGFTILAEDADIDAAAAICGANSMRLAGQSCVSVQNIAVHESLARPFAEKLAAVVDTLKVGDPLAGDTDIGTLIDEAAAIRVDEAVARAVSGGAEGLRRGGRAGAQLAPSVLFAPAPEAPIVCEEIFGPAVSVVPYRDIEEPFAWVNRSRYGLQTGLFTQSLPLARRAMKTLRTGGLVVGGTSTWRADEMPYGGVGDSGIGREGPRYAIREMSEERLAIFNV
ncbi:aldehyde dehydrogenase family protein [Afifella sp. IM 167]|uniref:aldehyde dehydrogenase family protein n=1 Tax=Afifella sp. IM 167 TaxID=2033586 RepID=UPI001CCD4546|nr:aldehyde dehydrogenase family protein [Afifella sp. IM 167]MBZ8133324.1 2-hydroxymuconic semialdehyde dehydrogenase [Afifella sp. IM 167]